MENMKCYINHKFTTIAWGLVFIIILFCGCSNMVETLRALSDAELSVVLLCNDNTNATNIEIPLGEAQSFSFIVKDKNTGEIIDNVYFLKDIQWGYPKKPLENSDTIEVSFPENKHTMRVKGVKATETPNEIYVTVNGVKSNVCTVTVKDPWEDIEVVIAYDKIPVEEFKLPLHRQRHLSVLLRDKNTKEFITPPPTKDGIQWTYPQNDRGITYATDLAAYGDVLTLIGEREVTEPQEIFVTINGIRSESCMVTVGNFYAAETQEELDEVIKRTESSAVTEIHIAGPSLVSNPNSINEIAQKLQEKDANGSPVENGKKYTLDLTAATDVDLSSPDNDTRFNSSIERVSLPEGLTTIGEHAFWGFTALAEITIPSQVTTIGKGAFGSCFGIEEIVIPASVESIGEHAFSYCTGLEKIRFEPRDKKLEIAAGAFAGLASKVRVILDKETAGLITGASNILERVPQP